MRLKKVVFFLVCLLILQGSLYVRAELEGFDEPATAESDVKSESIKKAPEVSFKARAVKRAPSKKVAPSQKKQDIGYGFEIFTVVFLLGFGVSAYYGTQKNLKIAESWCSQFCGKNGLFDRNFSLIGTGTDELLKKENSCQFKFYASGRRYCQGLLATINLRGRSNLFTYLFELISPSEDTIDIEVFMNSDNMPSVVLALATPKVGSSMLANVNDLKTYTRKMTVNSSNTAFANWNNKKLTVLAEHSAVFYELFSDSKFVQAFTSTSDAYAPTLRLFRSLHISDEFTNGSHQHILRFRFVLPSRPEDMILLAPLMDLVPRFIDLVGTFKLSADIRRKTQEQRAKLSVPKENEDEVAKARKEAAQQRKLDKIQEEKERMARMNPEARRKYEDKLTAKAAKKSMRVRKI